LDVREVRSVRVGDHVYRALLVYSEVYPFLVIEKVRISLTEGDEPALISSWKLREMDGGAALRLQEGDDIKELRWNKSDVLFVLAHEGRHTQCVISQVIADKPKVSCRNT
jgi:hypothetical protein